MIELKPIVKAIIFGLSPEQCPAALPFPHLSMTVRYAAAAAPDHGD